MSTTTTTMIEDTPMTRRTIAELTYDQLVVHTEALRERRLAQFHQMVAAQQAADEARCGKLRKDIEDQCRMLEKDFKTCDNALERIDKRVRKIEAARLELEQMSDEGGQSDDNKSTTNSATN